MDLLIQLLLLLPDGDELPRELLLDEDELPRELLLDEDELPRELLLDEDELLLDDEELLIGFLVEDEFLLVDEELLDGLLVEDEFLLVDEELLDGLLVEDVRLLVDGVAFTEDALPLAVFAFSLLEVNFLIALLVAVLLLLGKLTTVFLAFPLDLL